MAAFRVRECNLYCESTAYCPIVFELFRLDAHMCARNQKTCRTKGVQSLEKLPTTIFRYPKVKVTVAKFHINPEKGPMPCSAQEDQCPYGADAPHFENKADAQRAFEAALEKETQPLGSLRKNTARELEERKSDFAKTFESMEYSQIEEFANDSKDNHKIIDSIIDDRVKESYERYLKLDDTNPYNPDAKNKCDVETYKSLKRDYESYRDKTAELVEAHTESKFYVPAAKELPDPSRLGNAVQTTGFEPNSREWLEARFDTVGGSDVGALAKMDFTPAKDLKFYDKKGLERSELSKIEMPSDESIAKSQNLSRGGKAGPLYRGTVWEDRIRDDYTKDHPELTVYNAKDQYMNPERPWQKINVDGVISDRPDGKPNGILEIKTGSDAAAWETSVPIGYRAQSLYYLNATGLDFVDVRALVHDNEVKEYRIYANEEVAPGSNVNMEQYINNRVSPWFDGLKARRTQIAA